MSTERAALAVWLHDKAESTRRAAKEKDALGHTDIAEKLFVEAARFRQVLPLLRAEESEGEQPVAEILTLDCAGPDREWSYRLTATDLDRLARLPAGTYPLFLASLPAPDEEREPVDLSGGTVPGGVRGVPLGRGAPRAQPGTLTPLAPEPREAPDAWLRDSRLRGRVAREVACAAGLRPDDPPLPEHLDAAREIIRLVRAAPASPQEERGVLPDERWQRINERWHIGARVGATEVGELLDLALEYHLRAVKLERTLTRPAGGSEARERVAEIIEQQLGYTNGWRISEDDYRADCREAADRILATLHRSTEPGGENG